MSFPPRTSLDVPSRPAPPAGGRNAPASHWVPARIPVDTGVGLKRSHYDEVLGNFPPIGWFEVHAENYMVRGGAQHAYLSAIREHYPISLHGVGLSLGSRRQPSHDHLARLKHLIDTYRPGLVSEHLAWSAAGGNYFNDLFPVPLTRSTLAHLTESINRTQDYIGRRILIENPSTYLATLDDMEEPEFLEELCFHTGCGLLLDINNVVVSCRNNGLKPADYMRKVAASTVEEIHLAGHKVEEGEGWQLRIDDHGSPVDPETWDLFREFVRKNGPRPTLIEWDTDVPPLGVLLKEAGKAKQILDDPAIHGPMIDNSNVLTR